MPEQRSKVFGIGETVLDVIIRNSGSVSATPGGSMLNGIVSLGRSGVPAFFISEYGLDQAGDLIDRYLRESGVDTSWVYRYPTGKTALALAFLDENMDAHYTFYRDFPERRLDIRLPVVSQDDIFLYGSYYAISQDIRPTTKAFIQEANRNGALLIYDPNFRRAHLHELERLKPSIIENIQMASLIKGSNEDFHNIFGTNGPNEAWEAIRNLCPNLVFTANTQGVYLRTASLSKYYKVPTITPVSTIGAGDNFTAGMIVAIHQNHPDGLAQGVARINSDEWDHIISMGIHYATEVCLSTENSVSQGFY